MHVLLTGLALLLPTAPAVAQGGRIPVRVVDGRLVTACDVSGPARRIPVNLFVEFDTRSGLQLDNRVTRPLGVECEDGTTVPISLHFPDFTLEVPRREIGDQDLYDEFAKYHSTELGENALAGVIGAKVFEGWHLTLGVGAGWIELSPESEATRRGAGGDLRRALDGWLGAHVEAGGARARPAPGRRALGAAARRARRAAAPRRGGGHGPRAAGGAASADPASEPHQAATQAGSRPDPDLGLVLRDDASLGELAGEGVLGSPATPSATPSRPTSSRPGRTSARSRSSWGTRTWPLR